MLDCGEPLGAGRNSQGWGCPWGPVTTFFFVKFLFSEIFLSSRQVDGLLLPLPSALLDLSWL